MKTRFQNLFHFGLIFLVLLSGCRGAIPPQPEPPFLGNITRNAYVGVGDNVGRIELDNPLEWKFENNEDFKDLIYYSFRFSLFSKDNGDFELFWAPQDVALGTAITQINGPCPVDSHATELELMKRDSISFTGLDDGPAIFSTEVAEQLSQSTILFWESCEIPPSVEVDINFKNFTLLINADLLPGRLQYRLIAEGFSEPSSRTGVDLVQSPFHMAAIGDSIMWGQGLEDEDKFWVQIRDRIARETNQSIRARNFAHSGAIIADGIANDCSVDEELNGEIPRRFPNIHCQFSRIAEDGVVDDRSLPLPLERLDLLLIDGCGNDVGAFKIVFGEEEAANEDTFRPFIAENCRDRMRALIQRVRQEAPNAHIIITGYFPLLSEASVAQCSNIGLAVVLGAIFAPGFVVGAAVEANLIVSGADRSEFWINESNRHLGQVALEIDQGFRDIGVGSVSFVPVAAEFVGHEAFVGLESWVWGLDCFLSAEDPVREERIVDCENAIPDVNDDRFICDRASAVHPDVEGAAVYTRLIDGQLRALGILPRVP